MPIRIEDNFEDVLMKAATGLGLGKQALADAAGLTHDAVAELLDGTFHEAHLRAVAPVLHLAADALVAMAQQAWQPDETAVTGLYSYNTPFPVPGYEEMTVNSFLVKNPASNEAIAFDTGANVDEMLADAKHLGLDIKALFITHTHPDHIAACDTLLAAHTDIQTFAPTLEPHADTTPVNHADTFEIAGLHIEARLTNGHSPGGTSYLIQGLERYVAICGDSLFCLSQGGTKTEATYTQALKNNRDQLLSLPDETVLCPGHGPCTTVGEEKSHNPFFPEFK